MIPKRVQRYLRYLQGSDNAVTKKKALVIKNFHLSPILKMPVSDVRSVFIM